MRFYLDFCDKYGHAAASAGSRDPFLAKLASKNQSVAQRSQASAAVKLLLESAAEPGTTRPLPPAAPAANPCQPANSQPPVLRGSGEREPDHELPVARAQMPRAPQPVGPPPPAQRALPKPTRIRHEDRSAAPLPGTALSGAQAAKAPAPGGGASWEQEYRDLEAAVLLRNYSPRTLEAYRFWIARFQSFVRSRPAAELGIEEVRGFLSDLAVREHVAASTQNQAFGVVEG